MLNNQRIIISKTNQIGDVIFALPLASAIKKTAPNTHIIFMGRAYTQDLIEHYSDVDEFLDWEALEALPEQDAIAALKQHKADIFIHVQPNKQIARLAHKAKIKTRIGTSHRLFHWLTCNKRVSLSRKKSPLHETQLDMKLLAGLGLKSDYNLAEITVLRHFKPFKKTTAVQAFLDSKKFNLILHPLTRGRHIEWPLMHFANLIQKLDPKQFNILVTASEAEGKVICPELTDPFPHVHNVCGKLSLNELMALIANADGMVCASTGPVHLAAAFGIHTLGMYAPIKPFHAGRWGPVGSKAQVLNLQKDCSACRLAGPCACIAAISVQKVKKIIEGWV